MKQKDIYRQMVTCFFILCFICVGFSPAGAWAGLKVEPLTYDFGAIDEGTVARVQFLLENTGDQDATIKNVRIN